MKKRTIVAPSVTSDFAKTGKLAYWKQVLPMRKVHYTTKSGKRAVLDFDEQYLTDLAKAFEERVLDQTPFVLADADNRHTMQPEHFRGEVAAMRLAKPGEPPGLYAKIVFPNKEAAKAVVNNPRLGVSARIREGVETPDGKTIPRAMIHVLGTMDPQVTGMAPWMPTDLSKDLKENVLDLSGEHYEGVAPVAKNKSKKQGKPEVPAPDAVTDEWLDNATEEELEAFLTEYAPGMLADINNEVESDDEDESDEDEPETEDEADKELEPALSAKDKQDIELANSRAQEAERRANEALARMAEAQFKEYRTEKMSKGVPAWVIDLAKPVLNRHEDMTVDLSNEDSDEDSLNVGEIVRRLVDGYEGFVDLSRERGHQGVRQDGEADPDKPYLDAWDEIVPL
jgi:hypothetical protein